jgi:hypothetical protein
MQTPPEQEQKQKLDFRVPFATGMLVTLIGGYADAWWHLSGLAVKEGFFTPAHATIYGGVLVMILSVYFLQKKKLALDVKFNRKILVAGLFLMSAGGAWDFVYHSIHGFVDVVAWTPPHLTVTAGFVVLMIGSIIQFGKNSSKYVRSALMSSALLFVALWITVIALTI